MKVFADMKNYTRPCSALLLSLGACHAANGTVPPVQEARRHDSRPNILYIMSDDHASQTIGVYAGTLRGYVSTPNIDRIGKEGVIMQNCFATNSISTPSRAAIITGKYSHHNQVYTLLDSLPAGSDNMAKRLCEAGYSTAMIGKWHLGTVPEGFDHFCILPGQGAYTDPKFLEGGNGTSDVKGIKVKGYSTDIITDMTMDWIRSVRDSGKPFFAMCHYKAPHTPFTPAPRHADLYQDTVFPEPESLYEFYRDKEAVRVSTSKIENTLKGEYKGLPRNERRQKAYQEYIRKYLRCTAAIDENVGRLLDYLEEIGELDNTIVVYTSDQGFFVGEHGLVDKRFIYEESIRMPLLIRYPKEIQPGTVCGGIVLNVDFAPTFLDYAGAEIPGDMDGRSFRKELAGAAGGREAMYYRYWMDVQGYSIPAHYGIRTDRYKLVYFSHHVNRPDFEPVWELYDLQEDPMEMNNLYGKKGYGKLTQELKEQLYRLQEGLGDKK